MTRGAVIQLLLLLTIFYNNGINIKLNRCFHKFFHFKTHNKGLYMSKKKWTPMDKLILKVCLFAVILAILSKYL